jgi:mannose-6-phosphate isomerase-like protein (cupin superfamily)
MKYNVTREEALARRQTGKRAYELLTKDNGCVNGCRSGITVYDNDEFPEQYGSHEDQEGFYVIEGEGFARVGDEEFSIKTGDSFLAPAGVRHTIKCIKGGSVTVLWFHAACGMER